MSNGETIRVTLCAAPTPLVSYICVWCPGLQTTDMMAMRPSIEAVESDLLLLRVTVSRNKANFFIYKTNGGRNRGPSLRPIQIPAPCLDFPYSIVLLGHCDLLPSHGEEDASGLGSLRSHGVGAGSGLVSLHSHGEGAGSGLIPYMDGQVVRFRPPVDDAGHYYLAGLSFDSCSGVKRKQKRPGDFNVKYPIESVRSMLRSMHKCNYQVALKSNRILGQAR